MESNIKRESLAKIYGVKDLKTITEGLSRLEEKGLIRIDRRVLNGSKGGFKRNKYTLIDSGYWVQLDNSLLSLDLKRAFKGFLILFKCICLNGTNKVLLNNTQIAELLGVTPKTVATHIKSAIDLGYIKEIKNGYELTDSNIFRIMPESDIAFIKNFYPEILTDEDLINNKLNNNG